MAYNGKLIGPKNEPEFFTGNGIWNLNSIQHWLRQGKWYFNRSATASATSVIEGDTFTVTLNTVGVPNGTVVFWTTNTITGTISTADFTDLELTGYRTINNNTCTVSRKIKWTTATSGARQFTIVFRTENIEGPIVASSPVITVNDLATGGTEFTRGAYRVHRFGSSAIFTTNKTITADVFLVAGGGGGGYVGGGGGGAGGVRNTTVTIPAGSRWVYVGGGGGQNGQGGYTTIVGVIDAVGGGGGGNGNANGPSGGGSGGGGGFNQGAAGGTPGQGNNGGNGRNDGNYGAGGGGGGIGGGGGDGYRTDTGRGGNGGPGGYFDPGLDGTAEPYAGGGGGARYFYGFNGTDGVGQGTNRGGGGRGGGGRPGTETTWTPGDTGVCYIRYLIPT